MFKKFNEMSNVSLMDNKSLKEFKKNFVKNYPEYEQYYD